MVQRLDEYTPLLKRVCAVCLPFGLAGTVFVFTVYQHPAGAFVGYLANVLYFPSAHLMIARICFGIGCTFPGTDSWKRGLAPFAAVW